MSHLDINTPKGREAALCQSNAIDIVASNNRSFVLMHTNDTGAAKVDVLIFKNDVLFGVAEIKSRSMNLNQLAAFNHEWLVSMQKIWDMQQVSELLRVPAYGWLYLQPEDVVLSVKITDDAGLIVCNYRADVSATKATCNGGTANRHNAFINMRDARVFRKQT